MNLKTLFLVYVIIINLVTYFAFASDKYRAQNYRSRIPEKRLHTLTLLGGTLGAWLAIFRLRHKNRKFSFLIITFLITVLQAGLGYLLIFYI
ncbi:MAG: DUF1294 domain-containing protein [Bacteroidia bacterium]|nr:DUF1294 domain-containing protein [Bacteroidia bacterium]MDW8301818.1 DUF1294 domain-containing protein [Bacteroidia bacterium]